MTDKNVKLLHILNKNQFSQIEMKSASRHEPKIDLLLDQLISWRDVAS